MSINYMMIFTGLLIPFTLALDFFSMKRAKTQEEHDELNRGSLNDLLLLLIPLAALIYSDQYWKALVLFTSIFALGLAVKFLAHKVGWAFRGPQLVIDNTVGLFVLSIAFYFIFFHRGPMSATEASVEEIKHVDSSISSRPGVWVVAMIAYGLITLSTFVHGTKQQAWDKKGYLKSQSLLLPIAAFNILPFFTAYFWWCLIGGIILYGNLLVQISKREGKSTTGGAYAAFMYIHFLAAGVSALIYGLLF